MSAPFRVHVLGFSAFERNALASYFRLAANRTPSYQQADSLHDADFLVVDADHAGAVATTLAEGRLEGAVFIGAAPPDGAAAWMMRPIDPLHVLRELDAMVAARAPQRVPPTLSNAGYVGTGERTVAQPRRKGPVPARRADDEPAAPRPATPPAASPANAPEPPAAPPGEALLVDDSAIALRFLQSKLERYGLATELATSSAKAIELLSRRHFQFVFLDVELGLGSELDGLALCQHIKRQHHYPAGQGMPVVALVSAHSSEIDRVRGTLAGADAYLAKPLDDGALRGLLVRHGLKPPALPEAAEYQ